MKAFTGTPLTVAATAVSTWFVVPLVIVGTVVTSTGGALSLASSSIPCGPGGGAGGGTVQSAEGRYTAEQMTIARTVINTTAQRRLPRRAAVLAVATAMVESDLRNLDHGDRDSLGVFQQRPSQGWGTREQLLDPVYATNAFLDHLVAIPRWRHLPDGVAEQLVQRSGYPRRYAPRHPAAEAMVTRFWNSGGATTRVSITVGCPDNESSDTPLDKQKLPKDFTLPRDARQKAAVTYTISKIGQPYVWGAKGPDTFDCSGLMMAAWAHAGVAISASTTTQIHDGRPITSFASLEAGDLIFIPGSLGTRTNPRHVGMYIGHELIVNAYDEDTGVVVERLGAWRDDIVAIRRVHGPPGPRRST